MKAFYKEKNIMMEIEELFCQARKEGKLLDHIELNEQEFSILSNLWKDRLVNRTHVVPGIQSFCPSPDPETFYFEYQGVKIIKEKKQ